MRVLLIQPSERLVLGKRKIRGSIMPPLGLLALAAVIRDKCPGTEVRVADYEAKNGETNPDFADYDIIGLSGTTVHVPHAAELARAARIRNPEACIIMGGSHASFCDVSLLRNIPELDAVLRGEGDLTIGDFIRDYAGRGKLPAIRGVSTRGAASDVMGHHVKDLDLLPHCAYDLVDLSRYQLSTHRRDLPLPFAAVVTSRGCPFSCAYCQTPNMFGNRVRRRSAADVAGEIRELISAYKVKSIVFWDDTFTFDQPRTEELCRAIGRTGVQWMCNTRVECVTPDLLTLMRETGCRVIFYGVESVHEKTLKAIRRTTTIEQVRRAFDWTRKANIKTVGTLMIGAPGDTLQLIDDNIEFLTSLKPSYVYISIYNATPGADEYRRAQADGTLPGEIDWTNPDNYNDGAPFGLPTINKYLSRFALQEAQKYVYEKFYGREDEYA